MEPGLVVTSSVAGDANDADIQSIAFIPLPGGGWKAAVTATVKIDGNIVSITKEFMGVPSNVQTWLTGTGLPLAKQGIKGAL